LATISVFGVIFLLVKLRKLNLAIIILSAELTGLSKALDTLQLTREARPTEPTKPSIHQAILEIITNYWIYFIVTIIVLATPRKCIKIIWNQCTNIMDKSLTDSFIIVYLSNEV